MNSRSKPSRRRIIKSIASAGVATAAGRALGAPATTASTTQAGAVAVDDLAAVERVLGQDFSDGERKLMADAVAGNRQKLRKLRSRKIPPEIEPAVRFDPRLPGMKFPAGASSCTVSAGEMPDYNGDPSILAFATVTQLSRLLAARKLTSLALTKMYLERLKSIGPKLNCVITLTEELALVQARRADEELAGGKLRGPLHGIPWGAKDLLATKGIRTTWGAAPYLEQVFDYDATVVRKLEEAGAVLCAKLSLGELCMGDVWFNGLTRTPWNPKEGSSGSSAGPCAAVAAGLVAFAIGSETLGSIISPCMTNGTVGLRPTYGRVSRFGAMPLARTMDKLGPIARGVEDCAVILHAIHGPDDRDATATDIPFAWNASADLKALRVGWTLGGYTWDDPFYKKNPQLKKIHQEAFDIIRSLVGEMATVKLPATDNYAGLAGMIIACESASSFSELVTSGRVRELRQQDKGSWPNTFRSGALIPASDYLRAMQVRTQLQHEMAELFQDIDLFVTIPYVGPTISYTNLTGHPSLVCRCGMLNGRPKMIEFVGNLYREDAICRVALAFERAISFSDQWPDTSKIPPLQ